MDLTEAIAPKSDQLDACELTEPRTFTITKVVVRSGTEQPVDVHLADFPRVWRPCKSMLRVLSGCWGKDSKEFVGRRVTLYCDPEVAFGGIKVGGIRVSHLSHIDKAKKLPLLTAKGRAGLWPVQPLPNEVPRQANTKPLGERIDGAVAAFGALGATGEQLERRVGRNRSEWTAQDVDGLTDLYGKLKGGQITKDEAFPPPPPPAEPDPTLDENWGQQ